MSKTIEIRIKKDGKISIDVEGVEGASCAELTRCLTNALGTVEEVKEKPAMYAELDTIPINNYETDE